MIVVPDQMNMSPGMDIVIGNLMIVIGGINIYREEQINYDLHYNHMIAFLIQIEPAYYQIERPYYIIDGLYLIHDVS